MKNQKLLGGALALALVATSVTPAFAADINTNGGNSSVPVELTTEAATFSVTVPTALPIDVDADGVVTTADDVAIVNNSHGAVKVTNMTIEGADAWEIVNWDSANMTAEKVGATKVAMTINGDKTTADDTITFTEANFPKMDGTNATDSDELPIVYDAQVPAQATALSDLTVANVVFTVGWDVEEAELIQFTITPHSSLESRWHVTVDDSGTGVFQAEEGMTWTEWVDSKYNTSNGIFEYSNADIWATGIKVNVISTDSSGNKGWLEYTDGENVNKNDIIENNKTYEINYEVIS